MGGGKFGGAAAAAASAAAKSKKKRGGGGGGGGGVVKLPAYTSHGSVVNAKLKVKQTPPTSSNLGKFLDLKEPPRSDISKLISKFIKLNNRQNPGMKKDFLSEDKLRSILAGKDRIGISEIAKLLSQQFKSG